MVTSEIDWVNELSKDIQTFTNELQQVLHGLGGQIFGNCIKPSSAQRYSDRLMQCVNEERAEG